MRVLGVLSAVVVLLVVGLFALALARPENLDDGFIVLVYARHLVAQGGFFWNASDGTRTGSRVCSICSSRPSSYRPGAIPSRSPSG